MKLLPSSSCRSKLIAAGALSLLVLVFSGFAGDANMLLGNPSEASASNKNNYLMKKEYFTLSYNNAKGEPNWVSWRVTDGDLGDAPRKRTFSEDATLPASFKKIVTKDYVGCGFDRGHMCPHSDRAANQEMSYATFIMTNIIPQAPNVNEKAWEQLEEYIRSLATNNNLYVIAGPVGTGGIGKLGYATTIANGAVTVPSACWKIVVVVPKEGIGADVDKIGKDTRVIAVVMPNDNTKVGWEWDKFRTSVSDIEDLTGYDFFTSFDSNIQKALKTKIDKVAIPAPNPPTYHHN